MKGDSALLVGAGLHKRYGGVTAVDDVAIHVDAGEVLGLVGPNGAGKTTVIDLITGAQEANSGELVLAGHPLVGPPSRRARLGLARTFQHPQLALDLTAAENILVGQLSAQLGSVRDLAVGLLKGFFRAADRLDLETVEAIAAETGVLELERPCSELSLGQQRLVEVARALAQNPQVMILDEPFAGSDAAGVEGIRSAIRTVQRRGHGVILVDHNVDIVASLVDRVQLLDMGSVVFDGDPGICLASEEMQRVYFGDRRVVSG